MRTLHPSYACAALLASFVALAAPAQAALPATGGVELRVELSSNEVRTGTSVELTVVVTNGTDDLLEGLDVQLQVVDPAGLEVLSGLTIGAPQLTGIAAVDGSAGLAPGGVATVVFDLAVAHGLTSRPTSLRPRGTVSAVLEGTPLARELPTQSLRVYPSAELEVELYLPRATYADWPATPATFEAVERFPVGLVVRNVGSDPALGLGLGSLGPLFLPDPSGAAQGSSAVELELDGISVPAGFALAPSLLGDLQPGAELELLWTATPFALGQLAGFDRAWIWSDLLAGPFLGQPTTEAEELLVHAAHLFEAAAGPLDDDRVDWLVDDPSVPAPTDPATGLPMVDFPDVVRMSTGADLALVAITAPTVGAPPTAANLVTTVEFTASSAGWHHLRLDAPGGAYFDLVQVVRSAKAASLPGLDVGGPADVSRVWVTERPEDLTGDGVPDVTRRLVHLVDFVAAPGLVRYDLVHAESSAASLTADLELLSAGVGGTQQLSLDAGTSHAGELYILLGSLSGTQPGTPVDSTVLPLNVDAYLLELLSNPSLQAAFSSIGLLDAQGTATAQITLIPGLPVGTGLAAHHAFLLLPLGGAPITFTSNPVPLFILP